MSKSPPLRRVVPCVIRHNGKGDPALLGKWFAGYKTKFDGMIEIGPRVPLWTDVFENVSEFGGAFAAESECIALKLPKLCAMSLEVGKEWWLGKRKEPVRTGK